MTIAFICLSIFVHFLCRFQLRTDVAVTSQVQSSLRKLLSYCREVVVKYRLAQELKLHDIVNELITSDNGLGGAIIKDTYSGTT